MSRCSSEKPAEEDFNGSDNMTLEDLNQHLALREKLDKAQELLISLRAAASPGTAKLTGMPHAPGVKDKVGDLAIEIADLSSRIEFLNAELARQEPEIEAFVAEIEDLQTRIIFRLRFLRGLSWKEVSQILGQYTTESSVKAACYRFFRDRDVSDIGPEEENAL